MNVSPPRTDRLDGYRAIAACLTLHLGYGVSEEAARRLSTRAHHPLPVDGYQGRVWTLRPVVAAWAKAEAGRRERDRERAGQR